MIWYILLNVGCLLMSNQNIMLSRDILCTGKTEMDVLVEALRFIISLIYYQMSNNLCKHLWVKFKINHKNTIIGIFYRSSKNNSLKEFLKDMDTILLDLVPSRVINEPTSFTLSNILYNNRSYTKFGECQFWSYFWSEPCILSTQGQFEDEEAKYCYI